MTDEPTSFGPTGFGPTSLGPNTASAAVWRRLRASYDRREPSIALSRSDVGELLAFQPRPTSIDPAYENRQGYDPDFLGLPVPLPTVAPELVDDLVLPKGSDDPVLAYLHFSLVMSASRRFARWTAVNLDGRRRFVTERSGDDWAYDPRIPVETQTGEALYADNEIDRGHLVRRQDPVWGDSLEEALAASDDTFHFTNCSPQHANFNQSPELWLGLEDYVLNTVAGAQLRAAVFTGPVLSDDDPYYRDVAIPLAFWKVVVTVDDAADLHATAYVLRQDQLIDDLTRPSALGPVFGAYKTFQVAVADVEAQTGVDFGALRDHDAFVPPDGEDRLELQTLSQTVL